MHIGTFIDSFMGKENSKIDTLYFDVRNGYTEFINSFYTPINSIDTYLNTTTAPFELMFMTPGAQMRYLNNVFFQRDALNPPANQLFQTVRICEECMNEDIAIYGEPYLHRSHQLTGTRLCHRHHTLLKEYIGLPGHACEYNSEDYKTIETNASFSSLKLYVQYVNVLFESCKGTNSKNIRSLLSEEMQKRGYTNKGFQMLKEDFNDWFGKDLFTGDLQNYVKITMPSAEYGNVQSVITMLMFLFPDPNEFLYLLEDKPLIDTYACDKCGHHFVASTLAMDYGWGCPLCDQKESPEKRYKYIISTISNNKYEALGFNGINKPAPLIHKVCGKELRMIPRKFIFQGTRCLCEQQIPIEEVKSVVEVSGDFELVEFHGAYKPIKILHKVCGRVFTCSYKKFKESSYCRICNPKVSTKEQLEDLIKNLVGDEYTLIEFTSTKKPFILRHNDCGFEQSYGTKAFTNGMRCNKCQSRIDQEGLDKVLNGLSDGRYTLVIQKTRIRGVLDIIDNKEIRMSATKILQEIMRPTPSPVLPHLSKTKKVDIKFGWDIAFELLCQYKEEFGDANIGVKEYYKGYRLGPWCLEQRVSKRNGTLKFSSEQQLLSIGFDFNPKQTAWNEQCARYERYVKENGKGYASRSVIYEDIKIGVWIERQRKRFFKGTLSDEEQQKLEQINPLIFTDKWMQS